MSILDIPGDIVDAVGNAVEDLADAAASLFDGAGPLVGIAVSGAALFVVGPGAAIPAFVAGAAAGNALIRHRQMTPDEKRFAEVVFRSSLPPNDRIQITNLSGIGGRAFVCPNGIGQILVNLGSAYDEPIVYLDEYYPSPGKLFVHELTHVWQIGHSTFVPGLVCEGIGNQLAGVNYRPGDSGKPWVDYNLEQQGTIVDEWFAPGFRGPVGYPPMNPDHPFFRYVCQEVRGEPLPRPHAMVTSGAAVSRRFDQLDVFWIGPERQVASQWWNGSPHSSWSDHAWFSATEPGVAAPIQQAAVVARRPDQMDVFYIAQDGAIGSQWWNAAKGMNWSNHAAFTVSPAGVARSDSAIAAVGRTADHLDVFWTGSDGAIQSQWWDSAPGMNWSDHQAFSLTPPNAAGDGSGLAAISRAPDQLDVFWVGPSGAICSQWWNGVSGKNWADHTAFAVTPPGVARLDSPVAAVARTPEHMDVFWINPDGAIASTWWDSAPGMSWGDHQPCSLTPPGAAGDNSGLAALSRAPNQLDVFWVSPNGAIGSQWWHAGAGTSWSDHHAFAITPAGAARRGSVVAAVARTAEHMDVFWIDGHGAVASTWWDAAPGMSWADHQPFSVAPPDVAPDFGHRSLMGGFSAEAEASTRRS